MHELSEPKRTAKYTTPPRLHGPCLSWLLWGRCADFGAQSFKCQKASEHSGTFCVVQCKLHPEIAMGKRITGMNGCAYLGNIPVTTTTKIFPKALRYKWEAYCNTNGRRTAMQMGGVLTIFPFPQSVGEPEVLQYKLVCMQVVL